MRSLFCRVFFCAFAFIVVTAAPHAQAAPREYRIDSAHTRVVFFISHTGYSSMVGVVRDVEGTFRFDPAQVEKSSVNIELDPKKVDTFHSLLNEKLQGKDFFDTATYPEMRFTAQQAKQTGKNKGTLSGMLTMHGVTKPVMLNVTFNKLAVHPYTKAEVAGFSAETTIRRTDFGMGFGAPDLIGDDVRILIEVEGDNATAPQTTPHRS